MPSGGRVHALDTNLREIRQKHYAPHHSNVGTDGIYNDREYREIFMDGIGYR